MCSTRQHAPTPLRYCELADVCAPLRTESHRHAIVNQHLCKWSKEIVTTSPAPNQLSVIVTNGQKISHHQLFVLYS